MLEVDMDTIGKIERIVEAECQNSPFYSKTSWVHSLKTAEIAKSLAGRNGADPEVAYLGGLLHDLGSIRYGRDNHHLTGARDAAAIFRSLNSPARIIAEISHCVYAHRSSQSIHPKSPEALCVAAADAIDHFGRVEELLEVASGSLGKEGIESADWLREKFARDWQKIDPKFRPIAETNYKKAQEKLNCLNT